LFARNSRLAIWTITALWRNQVMKEDESKPTDAAKNQVLALSKRITRFLTKYTTISTCIRPLVIMET